ncbi:c-type cytochrome [Neorhizobium galegae]|uniref:c-type cytochrome n=1 Tax=Neorhizobium galegae TaxID=399 RepID=UPI001F39233E|nr:cytochrome C [Neorhizobium galegae]UIK08897.1 cytochrome C [Neorhizobium galegae]
MKWVRRMREVCISIGLVMASSPAMGQPAVSPPAAPPGASSCSGCHAPSAVGHSIGALQGLSAPDILDALQAFRNGEREATVMGRIARGFSDGEMRAIAEWLARGDE